MGSESACLILSPLFKVRAIAMSPDAESERGVLEGVLYSHAEKDALVLASVTSSTMSPAMVTLSCTRLAPALSLSIAVALRLVRR